MVTMIGGCSEPQTTPISPSVSSTTSAPAPLPTLETPPESQPESPSTTTLPSLAESTTSTPRPIDPEYVKRFAVRVEQVRGVDVGCGVIVARGKNTLDVLTVDHLLVVDSSPLTAESYVVICWEEVDHRLMRRVYKSSDIVLRDPVRDLALLRVRVDKLVDKTADNLIDNKAGTTEQAVAELGVESELKNAKNLEAWNVRVTRDTPARVERAQVVENLQAKRSSGDQPVSYLRLNKTIEPGMSGGPLLDQAGRLIGIASGVSAGAAYYVDLGEVRAFLKRAQ